MGFWNRLLEHSFGLVSSGMLFSALELKLYKSEPAEICLKSKRC